MLLKKTPEIKGISINCHERFKSKANGAQKLECTRST